MKTLKILATALATMALAACTVHKAEEPPPLSGPSGLALSVSLAAIPDAISQDGGSQSAVRITAIGPNGRPVASLPLRLDMFVGGVGQDFGTLSARTVVTNSDGVATVVYTAPAGPPNGVFGTCRGLPGNCVDIVATPTGSSFEAANPQSVQIRLVPTGVILPPASSPTAAFTFSPSSISANLPINFDASTSTPGAGASSIVSYNWNFGDGTSASGRTVSHSFPAGNTFNVTLTVTNDRGLSSSTTQILAVAAGAAPVPTFTFSPAAPGVNEPVFFNATTSSAGSGHTIASYRWTFGDGATGSGATVSHAYAAAGTFTVQLTVTDEVGQSATSAGTTITIGNPPGPTARFTFSPTSPAIGDSVVFVASTSTTAQGSTITDYFWNFGDGTPVSQTSSPIISHQYAITGTFTVNLLIRDNAGRTSTTSSTVSIGSGAPVPTFTVSPASPAVGQTVTFDAGATQTSGGATIQSYSWNFGDSTTSTNGPVTTHIYGTAATRTVTLTVVDSLNRRATTSQAITITP